MELRQRRIPSDFWRTISPFGIPHDRSSQLAGPILIYMPPYTVLKVPKLGEGQTDVLGEFEVEAEAHRFIEGLGPDDRSEDHDYIVESPPEQASNEDRTAT